MKRIIEMNLRLFEGEGGGAGAAAPAADQTGENVQNTTGSAGAEEGQELEETPEERQAGYEKFKEMMLKNVTLNPEARIAENVYFAETEYRGRIHVKPVK